MNHLCILGALLATPAITWAAGAEATPSPRPNVVIILADDIGYGDFSCYGATRVSTPQVDRFATQGLRCTDAHSMASVCTPSRYALLTGEYAFRRKGTGIASGIEGLLIDPGRTTLPAIMKRAGYTTGVVGKWHLGLGTRPTDYNAEIRPGPLEIGFDHAWIMPATGDRVPCVWVEDRHVVNLDPADPIRLDYSVKRGDMGSFINGVPRIGAQKGGMAAVWKDEEMSTVIAQKGRAFIEQNRDRPFFLYLATHNIHVPRVPNPKFRGASACGVRGDTIVEFDWTVGQVLDTLDRLTLAANTLVIVTSDNGGVLDNNGPDKVHGVGDPDASNGHRCNGELRGTKGSVYEGGTRLPFLVRWPGHIQPGVSDALICQVDLLATCAALTGQPLAEADAPDSLDVLPALLGARQDQPCRTWLVEQNNDGSALALRKGPWKYIPGHGGGKAARRRKAGSEHPAEAVADHDLPPATGQLFNLVEDVAETRDVAATHPDLVAEMAAKLESFRKQGRSRPGATAP